MSVEDRCIRQAVAWNSESVRHISDLRRVVLKPSRRTMSTDPSGFCSVCCASPSRISTKSLRPASSMFRRAANILPGSSSELMTMPPPSRGGSDMAGNIWSSVFFPELAIIGEFSEMPRGTFLSRIVRCILGAVLINRTVLASGACCRFSGNRRIGKRVKFPHGPATVKAF
jgi:hypothetical protein